MNRKAFIAFGGLCVGCAYHFGVQPSNERQWEQDQLRLVHVTIDKELYHLDNVRDFHYNSEADYEIRYTDREVPLDQVQTVDLLLSTFGDHRALAHVYLSFGYTDLNQEAQQLVLSVEIRKEVGEQYSPIAGLFRQYELSYVIGTERDVVLLRINHRNEPTYLFPIDTPPEKVQALFESVMNHVARLETEPEFYNTLTNACGTNIMRHVNAVRQVPVPWTYRFVLPGYADALAYDLGLIDSEAGVAQLRADHYINELALKHGDRAGFSQAIRNNKAP